MHVTYATQRHQQIMMSLMTSLVSHFDAEQRTYNGFVLQMAHFYSKKSIVKKSLQILLLQNNT